MPHTNHLRFHRKQWALSQGQLAHLVGLRARSVISSYELGRADPGLRFALAYQFIFGVRLEALFPGVSKEIQDEIMRRAVSLDEACRDKNDPTSARVLELLQEMSVRADSHADA